MNWDIYGISSIYSNGKHFTENYAYGPNVVLGIWKILYPYKLHVSIDLKKTLKLTKRYF
jgi:hypothetical protein